MLFRSDTGGTQLLTPRSADTRPVLQLHTPRPQGSRTFVYSEELVQEYAANWTGNEFRLTVTGMENVSQLTMEATVIGDGIALVGDAQTILEYGIRPEQVLAVVTAVRRKGKLLKKGNFCWDFFEKAWIRMVPLRPAARSAYGILKRLLK